VAALVFAAVGGGLIRAQSQAVARAELDRQAVALAKIVSGQAERQATSGVSFSFVAPSSLVALVGPRTKLYYSGLDLMLPGMDGYEITKRLRHNGHTPIIMLTARDDAVDKVVGLELGADDYITKPFNPRELVARVRAVLRRGEARNHSSGLPESATIEAGPLRIEVGGREVFVENEGVQLTPKEFDLLVTLIENRGLVLTREQLLERVWGYTFLGDSRTIDVHVRQLRRKLGDACPIQTVWGTGYKVPAKR
jgi:DNA-binding response OmpR family regulator